MSCHLNNDYHTANNQALAVLISPTRNLELLIVGTAFSMLHQWFACAQLFYSYLSNSIVALFCFRFARINRFIRTKTVV